jgi:hypothetical protein
MLMADRILGYDGAGAYDGYVEPDDAPKWPAKAILFPH